MATIVNREAPYSGLANLMAMRGRMGDTELVHMSPSEIKGLASLGQLTVNPDTGLPEAFKLKNLLPTIAGIGAAVASGGTSLLIPAVATGLTSAVVNKDIGRGLFDGILAYAGGSIMRGLAGGGEAFGELAKPAASTAATATPSAAASQASQAFTAAQMAQVSPTAGSVFSIPAGSVPLTTPISPAAGTFTAVKDITPSFLGRQLGYETIKQGATLTPMQVAQLGGGTAGLTTSQMARFYAPAAAAGIGGAILQDTMAPPEYQQPELLSETVSTPRTPRTVTRTPLRSTPVTGEEALAAALGTGPALRFSGYTTRYANEGGLIAMLQRGGLLPPTQNPSYFEGMVPGTEHGMKDNVAFKVQGGNIDTAMLSPGEYVIPADVVAMLGNGNGDSGAKELDDFAKNIRQKAFGTEKQQKQINAPKELEQLATV